MDNLGGFVLTGTSNPSRKRRTSLNRRPPNESDSPQGYHDSISLSSTPSDLVSDAPSEGNALHEFVKFYVIYYLMAYALYINLLMLKQLRRVVMNMN